MDTPYRLAYANVTCFVIDTFINFRVANKTRHKFCAPAPQIPFSLSLKSKFHHMW